MSNFKAAKDEASYLLVRGIGAGAGPIGGMSRVVKARRGVENSPRRSHRVCCLELAVRDPVADYPRELAEERVNVRIDDLPRLGGELNIRAEELRVVEGLGALGVNEKVEPALQPLSGRPLLCND